MAKFSLITEGGSTFEIDTEKVSGLDFSVNDKMFSIDIKEL
jgi:hypothetical protein